MIIGRVWIEEGACRFPFDTRLNDHKCRDPKCPDLQRYPTHFHDGGLASADPDLEGDSA